MKNLLLSGFFSLPVQIIPDFREKLKPNLSPSGSIPKKVPSLVEKRRLLG
jgi:hypothetical protein